MCELARGFIAEAGLTDRIEVREGAALDVLDVLDELDGPSIDFLYVDCVKEEYSAYLAKAFPRLSASAVVVADNVLWRGHVARRDGDVPDGERLRTEALREFNRNLVAHPAMRAVVLPLGDGVAYAVKTPAL
jgi:predicted O-methyltransferase YrrM